MKERKTHPPAYRLTIPLYHDLRKDETFLRGEWRDDALCVELCAKYPDTYSPDDWFPQDRGRKSGVTENIIARARQACNDCSVRIECLVYALSTNQTEGIWAGHNKNTLKKLRRRIR